MSTASGASWWTRPRIIVVSIVGAVSLIVGTGLAVGVLLTLRHDERPGPLRRQLDGLVDSGFPAAIATVTNDDGSTSETAGHNERGGKAPARADAVVRIGSNTKMFTSVVMLQLAQQGKVKLDATVDTYLPGVLKRSGLDGSKITIRQLLQHTSGLPNYSTALPRDPFAFRNRYLSPRDLLDLAGTLKTRLAPGQRWEYSNTNYLVAGLIAERVSGRPLPELISTGIIDPLKLKHTSFPGPGDRSLKGGIHGYALNARGKLADITTADPSWAWAAGQMISTPSDLNRFMRALLRGKLLDKKTMNQMMRTVPAQDVWSGTAYGLGIMRYPLSCGKYAWGHGGDIPGFETRNAVAPDGTAITVAVSAMPDSIAKSTAGAAGLTGQVDDVVETTLCRR